MPATGHACVGAVSLASPVPVTVTMNRAHCSHSHGRFTCALSITFHLTSNLGADHCAGGETGARVLATGNRQRCGGVSRRPSSATASYAALNHVRQSALGNRMSVSICLRCGEVGSCSNLCW
jgi:hypothetical protein